MSEKAQLKDIISYKPEDYLNVEEIAIIRNTFKENPALLKVLRKVFLPTITDSSLPVEEFGKDLWFVGTDFSALSKDEVQARVIARQEAIKFVMGGIISLKQIANMSEETEMEKALRRSKDSTK